jgi:PAS domain S-box-containing protein
MAHTFDASSPETELSEIQILKTIIQNLADGIVVADNHGNFLFFNDVAQEILGIGAESVGVDRWSDIYGCFRSDGVTPFPPHELPLAQVIAGKESARAEIFIRNPWKPKGAWILTNARPLIDENGTKYGGVVVFCDITDRKEAESRILTLTNAVEQTADSIVITDRKGRILYVNPAFEQTTGYTSEEIVGQTPAILKSGLHKESFYHNLWETINAGHVFRATITNKKKSGTIYYAEQTITPMRDPEGHITHFVSVVKDVTEQRRLEEQEIQMKVARAVQQKLYRPAPSIKGFDLAGAAFPADATGGDYFDFVPLPKKCLGIAIGDVCGHGIGSALLMTELRACLRSFASKMLNIGKIFTLVNSALSSDLELDRYATLTFFRLHPPSRSFVYASAGHVTGYVLTRDGCMKQELTSLDIPLGLLPDRVFQSSKESTLDPGDILVLLTDGIIEAERPDQTQFGVDRTLDFIRDHRHLSAQEIITGLYDAVREFSEGLSQTDDITAVICKTLDPPAPKGHSHRTQ